jgi:predicted enzyme related to lactoylglutathione lyase
MNFLVNLDVDDLDAAIAFYVAAFGLDVGRRLGPTVAELLGGPAPIYLLEKLAGTPASEHAAQPRTYQRHWTPVHLDVVVKDIDSAVRQAVAAGAQLEAAVTVHAWGKLALMADPFGHGFCFVQFSAQGYDAIVDQGGAETA